jgi:hypothetical protein
MLDFFIKTRNIFNDLLIEAKGHLDHPEDLIILLGVNGANNAINAIVNTAQNPKAITIKWDGYPALIFGRGPNNKFSIMDKHMFNRKDGMGRKIYSPEAFAEYDRQRGVNRAELTNLIRNIWPGLQKASKGTKGYYWGDLLFSNSLKDQKGVYKFKANPNGITYTVDTGSDVGQLLTNKIAGIAVHQYISPDAMSTDDAQSLDGTLGDLVNNSNVAIVPSAMPILPNISLDKSLVADAKKKISKYGRAVEQLLNTAPQARSSFNQLFTTYINKKIVSNNLSDLSNDFLNYFESRPMTASMKQKLADHLNNNKEGIVGLFTIWAAIYQLKMNLVEQLNQAAEQSPVKGYLQSGQQSQEGFVSQGLKYVDRLGFSRQNLAAKQ